MYATSITITYTADGCNHQLSYNVSNTRPFYKLISEAPTKEAEMKLCLQLQSAHFKKSYFYLFWWHLKGMITLSKDPFMKKGQLSDDGPALLRNSSKQYLMTQTTDKGKNPVCILFNVLLWHSRLKKIIL